ncbi:GH116 family glycosyl-hydrolase [Jiangella alkaliphila]|uniref:Beta-Glucocerebrosidase 2 N terminal n=1 Tax=Jiangella alkaliphila TaxID=419479 RepID=A0A1H2LB92_9ACTN|nr:GH116 family glycosyl-hydrolase [Jiangella alkaliphila]SDU77985.1 beta-Glucocerebrosidase 2 N terminal [Jiangella alkaliphila]
MPEPRSIAHEDGRHVAMPLGGIGTGTVALGADGGLRQWQLHNLGNHRGDLPGSFLALRATQWEPPLDELRVLQARPAPGPHAPTPLVTDDVVPGWQAARAGPTSSWRTTRWPPHTPEPGSWCSPSTIPVRPCSRSGGGRRSSWPSCAAAA